MSTLNSPTGIVVANAAIVPAGTGGSISAFVSDASHLVLDINGYFAPEAAAGGLNLNAVSPCRVLDTRGAGGEFGGPILGANATRSYRPPAADCAVPLTASGYSLNATVVPTGPLGYLTLWPAGSGQPFVSTLNAPDGSVTSNAAILPAGGSGSIASFATSQTHLILDVSGYFGIPANCDLKFVPESAAFAFVGGNGSFQAISNCSDTVSPAVSLVPWVHIQSAPAAGTGSGTVTYSVDVGGTPRSGNIRVGHRVFTVLQAGASPD